MQKYFKIIETDSHQVLVAKDFSHESDKNDIPFEIVVAFFTDGVKVSFGLGFKEESERDENFDKIDKATVEDMVQSVL